MIIKPFEASNPVLTLRSHCSVPHVMLYNKTHGQRHLKQHVQFPASHFLWRSLQSGFHCQALPKVPSDLQATHLAGASAAPTQHSATRQLRPVSSPPFLPPPLPRLLCGSLCLFLNSEPGSPQSSGISPSVPPPWLKASITCS